MTKNDFKKSAGKKLKLVRLAYGKLYPEHKNQTTFAHNILNVKQDMLSKYETGRIAVPIPVLCKLKELGISLNWFFDFEAPSAPENIFHYDAVSHGSIMYTDFISNNNIKEINELTLKMNNDERNWLIGFLSGKFGKDRS